MRRSAVVHHAVSLSHSRMDSLPLARPRSAQTAASRLEGRERRKEQRLNIAWSTDDIVKSHSKKIAFFRRDNDKLSPRLVPPEGRNCKEVRREDPILQEQQHQVRVAQLRRQQQQQQQQLSSAALQQMHVGTRDECNGHISSIGIPPAAQMELRTAIQLGSLRESSRLHIEAEICTAERPSMTLRGSSRKYKDKFTELSAAIANVSQEPSPSEEGPFVHGSFSVLRFCTVSTTASAAAGAASAQSTRLGAFEVHLVWENRDGEKQCLEIFSKLTCGLFPNVELLVADLVEILPDIANARSLITISEGLAQYTEKTAAVVDKVNIALHSYSDRRFVVSCRVPPRGRGQQK